MRDPYHHGLLTLNEQILAISPICPQVGYCSLTRLLGMAFSIITLLRHNCPNSESTGIHYDQLCLRAGEPGFMTAWVCAPELNFPVSVLLIDSIKRLARVKMHTYHIANLIPEHGER